MMQQLLEEERARAGKLPGAEILFRKRGFEEFFNVRKEDDRNNNDMHYNNDAMNLLARQGYDPDQSNRQIDELVDMEFNTTVIHDLTDIDGHLEKIDDEIIIGKIFKTRKDSEITVKNNQKRWTAMNWSIAKKEFMESLGHISHKWKGPSTTRTSKELHIVGPYESSGLLVSSLSYNSSHDMMGVSSNSDIQQNEDDDIKEAHAKIVRKLNYDAHNIPSSTNDSRFRPIQELSLIVFDIITKSRYGFMAENDVVGYKTLLDMLSEMVGEGSTTPAAPGSFALTCFNSRHYASNATSIIDKKHSDLSSGAKKHFENQFWEVTSAKVDLLLRNLQVGLFATSSSSTKHRYIRTFVKHLWQSGMFPNSCDIYPNEDYPKWAVVYYCLRAGDVIGARDELYSSNNSIDKDACNILQYLSKISIAGDDFKERMRRCHDEFRRNPSDPFKKYVMNLLSLADQDSLVDSNITDSTEDFLWGHLWFIYMNRELTGSVGGEDDLFEKILKFGGADYFDPKGLMPFNYAVILFTCHRFGDAIAYLWETKKTIPAVHLTVVCLYYSLILPQRKLVENPLVDQHGLPYTFRDGSGATPRSILEHYCKAPFQLYFPEKTADYYISMDSNWNTDLQGKIDNDVILQCKAHSRTETNDMFIQLLLSAGSEQLQKLCGIPDERGSPKTQVLDTSVLRNLFRSSGRLDDYMKDEDIKKLLEAAGDEHKRHHRVDASMHMYTLAGLFVKVMEEFCLQLSKVVIPQSPNREYWYKAAVGFYEQYLKGGYGSVKGSLEKEGKENLQKTFEILINICGFMDLYFDYRYREALYLVDQLQLLPTERNNFNLRLDGYRMLDNSIKQVIGDVITAVITSTTKIISEIESEKRATSMDKIIQLDAYQRSCLDRLTLVSDFKDRIAAQHW